MYSLPHPNSAEAYIRLHVPTNEVEVTRRTMKRKVVTLQCYSHAIESETILESSSSSSLSSLSSSSSSSSPSRSSLEDCPPIKRLRRSSRTITRTTNTNTNTTTRTSRPRRGGGGGDRAESQQQVQSPQKNKLQQPTNTRVANRRRLPKGTSSLVHDVSAKDPTTDRETEVEKEVEVLEVGVIAVDPRGKGQHSEWLRQHPPWNHGTTTTTTTTTTTEPYLDDHTTTFINKEEHNDDDDDDGEDKVIAGKEDDILGVWGHSPSRDLPHMRQHCTRYPFHPPGTIDKTEENENHYCIPTQFTTTATSGRPILKNSKYCCGCYCFVCDVPAKECQQWLVLSSSDDEGHEEDEDGFKDENENHDDQTERVSRNKARCFVNHCCASETVQGWVLLREQERRRCRPLEPQDKREMVEDGRDCQNTILYQWVLVVEHLLRFTVHVLIGIPTLVACRVVLVVQQLLQHLCHGGWGRCHRGTSSVTTKLQHPSMSRPSPEQRTIEGMEIDCDQNSQPYAAWEQFVLG
jgi:hypothetical protein